MRFLVTVAQQWVPIMGPEVSLLGKARQTDMDGPIRGYSLTLMREEHVTNIYTTVERGDDDKQNKKWNRRKQKYRKRQKRIKAK
jgi:hypothetical protein